MYHNPTVFVISIFSVGIKAFLLKYYLARIDSDINLQLLISQHSTIYCTQFRMLQFQLTRQFNTKLTIASINRLGFKYV